jgi:protocatechuate 3,4-dioxygenase beta subunit
MTITRRTVLKSFALTPLASAFGDDAASTQLDASTDTCQRIASETAGPFPGDGTNGANALTLAGIVRSDIRSSVGPASATAPGVDLTMTFVLTDSATCMPLAGYAIYVWQCDRDTDYSMYTGAALTENYLRGVQVTDADGRVTFQTIFPGCYPGRWPHVHFEIYATLDAATSGQNKVAVSQLAFPANACAAVYATAGYETSVTNLSQITIATDGVFRDDNARTQLATMSGTLGSDLTATLALAIAT